VVVTVLQRKDESIIISKDEELTNVSIDKIPDLSPVVKKDGTVTAANYL
jgi:acetyl-CoA C-acetyltransferase